MRPFSLGNFALFNIEDKTMNKLFTPQYINGIKTHVYTQQGKQYLAWQRAVIDALDHNAPFSYLPENRGQK